MKCNYRSGCGATLQVNKFFTNENGTIIIKLCISYDNLVFTFLFLLQSFVFECSGLLKNRTDECTDRCKNTLIGLTSTEEGRKMMKY